MALAAVVVRRSLLGRPGRALLSILGIAVGIATVVGVYTLDHNTIVGLSKRPDDGWRPAIEVNPGERGDARRALDELASVSEVCRVFRNDVELTIPAGHAAGDGAGRLGAQRARLFAVEAGPIRDFDTYRLLSGRDLDPTAAQAEVIVGERLAERWGLAPGDELLLARPRRAARSECIDGELREVAGTAPESDPAPAAFLVVGVIAKEKIGWTAGGEVVLVDYARGLDLFRGARIAERFWVRQAANTDIEAARAELSKSFSYDFNKKALVGQAADERAYRNGVRLAGLLALVLGLYVIFHTLSMSLVERVREVCLLHAVGATRAAIARVFFLEAVVVAGGGALLGLGGGIALARGLIAAGVSTVGTGRGRHIYGFEVPWSVAIGLTALGFLIALAGSVYPLARARSADTVAALRGEAALGERSALARGFSAFAALLVLVLLPGVYLAIVPVVGRHQGALVGAVLGALAAMALLLVVPLFVPALLARIAAMLARPFERRWPLAGLLAARGLRTGRTRVAFSIAAVSLVVAAFVALKNMTASLAGEVEEWADAAFVDKVYVENLADVPLDVVRQRLAEVDGVLGFEAGSSRTYGSFLLLGCNVDDLAGYGPLAADPRLADALRERPGIVISKRLAVADGWEVGDAIPVTVGGGSVLEFRVVAISDAYGYFPYPDERLYGVIADRWMKQAFCLDTNTASAVAVRISRGTPPGRVTAALADLPASQAGLRITAGPDLLRFHRFDLRRDFLLFDLILSLSGVLAALGVLNGQLLAALERAKELGILKSLGARAAQVGGSLLLEGGVIGLCGGVLGALLGLALSPLVVAALHALSGLPLPRRIDGAMALASVGGALLLGLAAAAYPAWRSGRVDAVRAVRGG